MVLKSGRIASESGRTEIKENRIPVGGYQGRDRMHAGEVNRVGMGTGEIQFRVSLVVCFEYMSRLSKVQRGRDRNPADTV
jgi:hypothetical protein